MGTVLDTDAKLKSIDGRLQKVEETVVVMQTEGRERSEQLEELARILNGDEALQVKPLREEMKELSAQIKTINRRWDRAVWVGIGLGLTNAGLIGTFIAQLISSINGAP